MRSAAIAVSPSSMPADERACEGLFLAFQYPVEIPGVNNMYFLRAAINAQRRHRCEPELDAGRRAGVRGAVSRLPIPGRDPGREQHVFLAGGDQCAAPPSL